MRLEQPDGPAAPGIVEPLGEKAHHLALVVLVRPEHVEELQSRPLRRQARSLGGAVGHRQVEQMLAPAVQIQGLQPPQRRRRPVVAETFRAVPIGRGRGRIDERGMRRRAPFEQAQRQAEIGLDDQIPVGRGGVGDGAEMDDGIELAALEPAEQLARRHHVGKLALAEIAPFLPAIERIVDHDVAVAGLVEARHHVRSDESGAAGDQKHPERHLSRPPLPQSDRACNLAAGTRSAKVGKADGLRRPALLAFSPRSQSRLRLPRRLRPMKI